MSYSVEIFIPSLGNRPRWLRTSLNSIPSQVSFITIIIPERANLEPEIMHNPRVRIVSEEPNVGLGNSLLRAMQESNAEFVGWIGDDDSLVAEGFVPMLSNLYTHSDYMAAFGNCIYIDRLDAQIGQSLTGRWAVRLMRWGPNLWPQPGSLYRTAVLRHITLDQDLELAFDHQLHLRLSKQGKVYFHNQVVSTFRWHEDSLTVSNRIASAVESSRVRQRERSLLLRLALAPFELVVLSSTFFAGKLLSAIAKFQLFIRGERDTS